MMCLYDVLRVLDQNGVSQLYNMLEITEILFIISVPSLLSHYTLLKLLLLQLISYLSVFVYELLTAIAVIAFTPAVVVMTMIIIIITTIIIHEERM